MNRHEGVSCDSCLKNNFRGRRYKCLICIDYDLCATCYESGAVTNQHTTEHPMQCILTRSDFDLYYAGETQALEQPQAYTCPFCNRMGFTDTALMEHVTAEHADTTLAVVCPVCASLSGGEPNFVTDDFAGHLTLEHRTGPRDLISFLDEPSGIRHGGVRRMPPSGRGVSRARRTNMQFSTSGGISSLSPSSRDAVVDPIAELLSQLSGVRRGAGQPGTPSQLQQLQMQLQLERQQATAARQQLERLPRRAAASSSGAAAPPPAPQPAAPQPQPDACDSNFLLAGFLGASSSVSNEEAESRAALLRGLVLASLGRAPPAPPPQPAPTQPTPTQPAQPAQPTPPTQPAQPTQPAHPAHLAQPLPRTKPQPRTKHDYFVESFTTGDFSDRYNLGTFKKRAYSFLKGRQRTCNSTGVAAVHGRWSTLSIRRRRRARTRARGSCRRAGRSAARRARLHRPHARTARTRTRTYWTIGASGGNAPHTRAFENGVPLGPRPHKRTVHTGGETTRRRSVTRQGDC